MSQLTIRAGQASQAGTKAQNQDSIGIRIPEGETLATKGVAAIVADGVSSAEAGQQAAESCVKGFLNDYYSTPDSWSVETAGARVLGAINRWLHGGGRKQYDSDFGLVTTASVLILKSTHAHMFHVGDSRIWRLRGGELEPLSQDHHLSQSNRLVLGRAMGAAPHVQIDYQRLPLAVGDGFLLTTDGVHGVLPRRRLRELMTTDEPETAVENMLREAIASGSDDNVSAQILWVDSLPNDNQQAHYNQLTERPFPPPLEAGMRLDGYRVLREMHASKRTQVYLALNEANGEKVVLKTPSPNYQDDPAYIDAFLREEWTGRRLDSPHLLKVLDAPPQRRFLYYVTEYVEGRTLRQWMHDHPHPPLDAVRGIVRQIAAAVRMLHRREMVHQDLKPENILVDEHGTVKIIDFGSVRIRGIDEIYTPWQAPGFLGTEGYAAPECLDGSPGSEAADRYALGVIAYEMLTGGKPYASPPKPGRKRQPAYRPAGALNEAVPRWIDGCLQRAVAIEPDKRYPTLSEFVFDLETPNARFLQIAQQPLLERHPLTFWQCMTALSVLGNIVLLWWLLQD